MRSLLLSISLLLSTSLPVYAQYSEVRVISGTNSTGDSFEGAAEPEQSNMDSFAGANNGEIGQTNSHTGQQSLSAMTPEEFKRAAAIQTKFTQALKAGSQDSIAVAAYQLFNLTGDIGYKALADVATGESDIDDLPSDILESHREDLKQVLQATGRSDLYITQVLGRLAKQSADGAQELAFERNAEAKSASDKALAAASLRRFGSPILRVYIPSANGSQEIMVRHCIKRALEQICKAANNNLQVKFAQRESEANVQFHYDHATSLWYEHQRHMSPIIAEPTEGTVISRLKIEVPLKATMHRKVTEEECQEFCNREIVRALGYDWHPVSMERFTHDFHREIALARKHKGQVRSTWNGGHGDHGIPTIANCVEEVLYGADLPGRLEYFAGQAYVARGDYDMARRYFCNATEFLNNNSPALRSVVRTFTGVGDTASAELVCFACINDDEANDERSPATIEYEKLKKLGITNQRGLPVLGRSETEMLAKIYASTPAKASL